MNKVEINVDRLKQVELTELRVGQGKSLEGKLCLMQAVDYVTTGGFSDHPECACPVLTSYAISLNDRADSETRQRMKPLIPKLVGTRDGKTRERAEFLVHHLITCVFSTFVEAAGLKEDAETLRRFKAGQFDQMWDFCRALRSRLVDSSCKKFYFSSAYAYAAAYAADAYAAYAAAYAADAYAAAYAASASDSAEWKRVRSTLWDTAFEGLSKACDIREGS